MLTHKLKRNFLRVIIEGVSPAVDGGEFAVKRIVGDRVDVTARVLCDSHDELQVMMHYRHEAGRRYQSVAMSHDGNDSWRADFSLGDIGRFSFFIEAWVDRLGTWHGFVSKKLHLQQLEEIDLREGAFILSELSLSAELKKTRDRLLSAIEDVMEELSGGAATILVQRLLEDEGFLSLRRAVKDKPSLNRTQSYPIQSEPTIARFSSWYEFFPRSFGENKQHGSFQSCLPMLDYISDLGFSVVYLPPIHPIGESFRKGKNNSLISHDDDVGSPWAVGSELGGHDHIHPKLGTMADFERFVQKAKEKGLKIALDLAFHCSPDHPYAQKHKDWFYLRPDESIHYAENPPKKYQDIYPLNFENQHWHSLWKELRRITLYWRKKGISIFRVDNPHTKAFSFWKWLIESVKDEYPDTIFLSEAFTRPHRMYWLAKAGFSQSYTYFTWRHSKQQLAEYLTEITDPEKADYFRANFWPNTPDILPDDLHEKGPSAFKIRLLLAASLSSNYGIYGPAYELCENKRRDRDSEEYLNAEKYELKSWRLDDEKSIAGFIKKVNQIRNSYHCLQQTNQVKFLTIQHEELIAFLKIHEKPAKSIAIVVNLNPDKAIESVLELSPKELGLAPDRHFMAYDLLTEQSYEWYGGRHYIKLDPKTQVGHIFSFEQA
jgi:starch synthase (maltosyl-transferring)